MDPISDLQTGFKDALIHKKVGWDWSAQDTLVVLAVLIIMAMAFLSSHLFQRYRFFVRAGRKERKKREFLTKLLVDRGFDRETETLLLKRLVKYFIYREPAAKVSASQDQLVEFSRQLFGLMRRLEYDKRGRLVVPAIEKEMEEAVAGRSKPTGRDQEDSAGEKELDDLRPGNIAAKDMSKGARIALNFIRMRRGGG